MSWISKVALFGALVASTIGCRTNTCRDKTVLVALTLEGPAASAESLNISISIDGSEPKLQTVSARGITSGNLEIEFPSGYPQGHTVAIIIDAVSGNTVVATGMTTKTLGGGCERIEIVVGAGASDDGGGGDGMCMPTVTTCPADACGKLDDGCGGFVMCATPCQVTSVEPRVGNTGDSISIEGTFGATATVDFAGAAGQAPVTVGAHRIVVKFPAGAKPGALVVHTGNVDVPAGDVRRATYTLGLTTFSENYDQASYGARFSRLLVGRHYHTAAAIGGALYVFGGQPFDKATDEIERATINADGTLGNFVALTTKLTTARLQHAMAVTRNAVYMIGGSPDGTAALASVERAAINADGSIGAFTDAGTLQTARFGAAASVIGNYVYVVGGNNGTMAVGTVERAEIKPDGSLGAFATVTGVSLVQPRQQMTASVTGSQWIVVGGYAGGASFDTVEAAPISADGSVGTFAALSTVKLSQAQSDHSAALVGSNLYVVGQTIERAAVAADGTIGNFSPVVGANIPNGLGGPGAVVTVARDYLFLTGGFFDGGTASQPLRAGLNSSSDVGTFGLENATSLTAARSNFGIAVIGSYLYVIGGSNIANGTIGTVERATINADDTLGPFTAVSGVTLQTAREQMGAVVADGYVWVLGGSGPGGPWNTVERAPIMADGSLGPFAAVTQTLGTARYGHSSFSMAGYLCVAGGHTASVYTNVIECAPLNGDGTIGAFTTNFNSGFTPTTKVARAWHSFAVAGSKVYLVGGGGSTGALNNVETTYASRYYIVSPNFDLLAGAAMVTQRSEHANVLVGKYLYLVGGGSTINTLERLTVLPDASGTFATAPSTLVVGRRDEAAIVIGNRLYVMGGLAASTIVNSIESAPLQ